ncbi:MAG: DUF4440 domain-containing protein [Candidatus Bathyarchaeota archaeon]|nr:MAG: DUF4440 domain-containing protein [Candidatus Bathyarchaeota archaeon]
MKGVDIEAEKKLIEKVHRGTLADHTTNIDAAVAMFAEDAFVIPPNAPPLEGHEALREVGKQLIKSKVLDMGEPGRGIKRLEVSASGDLAYDMGKFRIITEGPEGPVEEKGYFVTLYKKIDGEWKLQGNIWNNVE